MQYLHLYHIRRSFDTLTLQKGILGQKRCSDVSMQVSHILSRALNPFGMQASTRGNPDMVLKWDTQVAMKPPAFDQDDHVQSQDEFLDIAVVSRGGRLNSGWKKVSCALGFRIVLMWLPCAPVIMHCLHFMCKCTATYLFAYSVPEQQFVSASNTAPVC